MNFTTEKVQEIAEFVAAKFQVEESPLPKLREIFDKEVGIELFHQAPDFTAYPEGLAIFVEVIPVEKQFPSKENYLQDENLRLGYKVTVCSPENEKGNRFFAESYREEISLDRVTLYHLLDKYEVIDHFNPLVAEKKKEEFLKTGTLENVYQIEINISPEFKEAQAELLAILQSQPLQEAKSIAINYPESFSLPQKFVDFFPKNAIELRINEKPFIYDRNANIYNTLTLEMPPAIKHLKNLTIGHLAFEKIPETFSQDFPCLKSLELTYKEVKDVDIEAVFKHPTIDMLSIKNFGLTEFPQKTLSMPHLEYLNLSNNYLFEIPYEMFYANLKYLDLKRNHLENIDNLPYTSLSYLNVSHNHLQDIPEKLINYLNVQSMLLGNKNVSDTIELKGNPLKVENLDSKLELLEKIIGVKELTKIIDFSTSAHLQKEETENAKKKMKF